MAVRKPAIRDYDDMGLLAQEAREVDNTGTVATEDRFENFRKLQREKEERRQVAAAQSLIEQFSRMKHPAFCCFLVLQMLLRKKKTNSIKPVVVQLVPVLPHPSTVNQHRL